MSPSDLKIRQRHLLKSKDIKQFKKILNETLPNQEETIQEIVSNKSRIEWIKIDNNEELYAINGTLAFWIKDNRLIPLLSFLLSNDLPFHRVKVDLGAIKFVSNGADVMRPGIIHIDEKITKDEVILIEDPTHGRVLAVGTAMFDANEMQKMDKGKVIRNIHSVNDAIWSFSKEF